MLKKKIKLLILSFGIIILVGCANDDNDDRHPYYKFNTEDETLLIKYNYVPNQIITYENQFGEQLHFKVILNEREKSEYATRGTLSGGGGYLSNYYDSKIIRIDILENNIGYDTNGDYSKVNYIFSKNFDRFTNGINFPMWNITFFSFIDELQNSVNLYTIDYNSSKKNQMNVNGHLFQNIVLIESNSNETKNDFSTFGPLIQNVNKIYYDYDFGIVQFSDTEGKEWKVIYPE
jgi:hypothetical protein